MHGLTLCKTKRRMRGAAGVEARLYHVACQNPAPSEMSLYCDISGAEAYTSGHLFVTMARRSPITYFRCSTPDGGVGPVYLLDGVFFNVSMHNRGAVAMAILYRRGREACGVFHILKWDKDTTSPGGVGNGRVRKGSHFYVAYGIEMQPLHTGTARGYPVIAQGCIRVLSDQRKQIFYIVRPCMVAELSYNKASYMLVDECQKPIFFAGAQKLQMGHGHRYLCAVEERRVLGPALPHRQTTISSPTKVVF